MTPEENKIPQEGAIPETKSRVYEVPDEESTIFSAPSVHKDKVKKHFRAKQIVTAAIALVLAVAVMVAVIVLVPKPEQVPQGDGGLTEVRIMDESLFAATEGADRVDRVNLIRRNDTLSFSTVKVEKLLEENKTEMGYEWALTNVDPNLTNYTSIDNTVKGFMEQVYHEKISDDKNDGNDYGFASPEYQVDFYKVDATEPFISLVIGNLSPTEAGRYVTTSLDNAVYFIRTTGFYNYEKTELDFAELEMIPAISAEKDGPSPNFSQGQLVACDKLVVSGNNFDKEYTIVAKEVDHVKVFNAYHITSPVSRPADDEKVGNIVSVFSYGLNASGCYAYSTDETALKQFGLDSPDFEVAIFVGDIKRTFSATHQPDGNYAVYYPGNKTIMKIDPTALSVASYTRQDLFNSLLFIESVTSLSRFEIMSGAQTVAFDIESKYDVESDSEVLAAIKVNGKEIKKQNFQDYYSKLIEISAQSYEESDLSGLSPTTTLVLHHKNGTAPTKIEYYQVSTSRYQVVNNGVQMGLISSSNHTRIMNYALNVSEDKQYNAKR